MFSKAKRFESVASVTNHQKAPKKLEVDKPKAVSVASTASKYKQIASANNIKSNSDANSQCSSLRSIKSFATPKPIKTSGTSKANKVGVVKHTKKPNIQVSADLIKDQEVEIRNKDVTLSEYNRQIEDLKTEVARLQKLKSENEELKELHKKFSQITLNDVDGIFKDGVPNDLINDYQQKIIDLEKSCEKLEQEVSSKQVELSSLEELITIRDSLCKDLQDKLSNVEVVLEETRQRLEMVKGHHALALEANESIRREYKVELETLKSRLEEEKQGIISKSKTDQENIKAKYNTMIQTIKKDFTKEKEDIVNEYQQKLSNKEIEMKAKLDQIDEATCEKLKLCEIQFEERTQSFHDHWTRQQEKIKYLEKEMAELKQKLNVGEEKSLSLQKEYEVIKSENEALKAEKLELIRNIDEHKEEAKRKYIDFENEINKLTVERDTAKKDKSKFEMSLSVTRDIVQVLTIRLRDSDNELEHLEGKVQTLTNTQEVLENELATYKNTLNNTILECNEYKEALVNILKSKAALAKEHTRIMEHNVSLIESLQNVEKEAYRELGSIKSELIEDVEYLKKESNSQIQMLREEVEKKRVLCVLATEHAGQATAAAEHSRTLLSHAADEISRLEADNQKLQQQIQDQQSLVVELSLLRQENEELTMTLARHSSIMEKMKKDKEQAHSKPKSPSVIRKSHKIGKENFVSPLRERNQ